LNSHLNEYHNPNSSVVRVIHPAETITPSKLCLR
jgi:hypothetical protein